MSALRAALISAATAAMFFALFVAAAVFAPQNQASIRQHLAEAVVSGEMIAQTTLSPMSGFALYRNVYDCLLFGMMLAPEQNSFPAALSNRMAVASTERAADPRVPPFPDCQTMLRALPELDGDGVQFAQYDRYILGMRVAGRVFLSTMTVEKMRGFLTAVTYGLLAAIVLAALYRARHAAERMRAAGHIAIATCFAAFFGAHYFDTTLNFGPMDDVHFLFVLLSVFCPLAAMRPAALSLYGAAYGSMIAIFEFLTGGIPLALALLPLLLALGFHGERKLFLTKLVTLWGCFCFAVIAVFVIKKLYAIVLLGDTEDFIATLLHRTYGTLEGGQAEYAVSSIATTYYRASAAIALGSSRLGALLITASLCAVVWMTRLRSLSDPIVQACWLSLLTVAIWYAVFLNHAILHAFYMARLLVVPVIAAATLLAVQSVRWHERAS
jgi:hypothetical protein